MCRSRATKHCWVVANTFGAAGCILFLSFGAFACSCDADHYVLCAAAGYGHVHMFAMAATNYIGASYAGCWHALTPAARSLLDEFVCLP
eukprot:364988-Chlamydomonas_euryale.AAC.12